MGEEVGQFQWGNNRLLQIMISRVHDIPDTIKKSESS